MSKTFAQKFNKKKFHAKTIVTSYNFSRKMVSILEKKDDA